MPYTHVTWGELKTALAARLHDTGQVFFVNEELGLYLAEALRTFNAFSSFWRERGTFNTAANTTFYDLPTYLPTLLGYTLTDRNVVTMMQYHLLETVTDWSTSTAWAGTEQFTMSDLVDAVQRRRNQFLADTGLVVTRALVAQAAPALGRVSLTDNIIDVRRVAWHGAGGDVTTIWREDEVSLTGYMAAWESTSGIPLAYSVMGPPPLTLQLAPIPAVGGNIDLVTVNSGANLNITTGVILGLPDDWVWAVKWGALADILAKDGPAYDPARSAWCEQRYQVAIELAKEQACVLSAQLQGATIFVDSLYSVDAAYANWQASAPGTVTDIGIAGYNLIAVKPVPNGIYSLTFDVIRRAPVPTADATDVQLGREQLAMILDYAEHLAMFKVGGEELAATEKLAENFVRQATTYNKRISAAVRNNVMAALNSKRETANRPRITAGSGLGTIGSEK